MKDIICTFSANAGISIEAEHTRLWIDAVHSERMEPYSPLRPGQWERMKEHPHFKEPDALLFTHRHTDHFSAGYAEEAVRLWPKTKVLFPRRQLLFGASWVNHIGALTVETIQTPHEGTEDRDEPHASFLIGDGSEWILFTGDAEIANAELLEHCKNRRIRLAICIFPWLTLGRGRTALCGTIRPEHLLLCHIPFAEDDTMGFCSMVEAMRGLHREVAPDIRLLTKPFQREVFR